MKHHRPRSLIALAHALGLGAGGVALSLSLVETASAQTADDQGRSRAGKRTILRGMTPTTIATAGMASKLEIVAAPMMTSVVASTMRPTQRAPATIMATIAVRDELRFVERA